MESFTLLQEKLFESVKPLNVFEVGVLRMEEALDSLEAFTELLCKLTSPP